MISDNKKVCALLVLVFMAVVTYGCAKTEVPDTGAEVTEGKGTIEDASGTGEDPEKENPTEEVSDGETLKADEDAEKGADPAGEVTHVEGASLIEQDIPDLRSIVASDEGLGRDAVIGACVGGAGAKDENLMGLVFKHFNAVTLENELKMDALFGYSNEFPPHGSIHEEEFDGEMISVPKLDFSRADAILDRIKAWNTSNPEKTIRVRGHVLVWHSQAPEWFFHEDYDPSKEYVSKEVMDRRLEWYIKSVLTYYTGEDSRYRGMFYGWDVVNEAVSDRGSYRRDTEPGNDSLSDPVHPCKSSWWKVYGSNEFIINAFRYANKYAPPDLRLYYNDYNDSEPAKVRYIKELIEAVKGAEGTRIDGFGMQGHYTVDMPSAEKIGNAVRSYSEVVEEVMITELDVKSEASFDGSPEKLPGEYERQAAYYGSVYEMLKKLNEEEGINITGITLWGVTDPYSWIQQQNGAGGGSDGVIKHYPLLFDGEYRAKPAFWAIADPAHKD